MTKAIEELPSTIDCSRKDCEGKIVVIDSYYVSQAGVPQIGVKCPECGKVTVLSKAKTIAYAKEYPQIQQDIDKASGYKLAEIDEEEEFGDKVMHIIEAFGYGGTKDKQRNIIIRSMIDMVPGYANQQALNDLLLSRGIKARDANQISQLACIEDGAPTMMPGIPGMQQPGMQPPGMQQPGMQPPGMQQQGMQQQPYYQPPYMDPQQQYAPQPYPQQPYPQQQPQPPVVVQQPDAHNSDDDILITEKLDGDGNVVERTIRQPRTEHQDIQPAQSTQTTQFKEMIDVMVDAGIINTNQPEQPQPLTADDLASAVAAYVEHGTPEKDDSRVDALLEEMKGLRGDMEKKERDTMAARIDHLEAESGKPRHDLSDAQYTENVRKDVEGIRVDAVKETLGTIVKPLIDLQASQSKLQTLMMVRQLEQQDGAPAGSYSTMLGSKQVPDDAVKSDLGRWHERAERAGAQ